MDVLCQLVFSETLFVYSSHMLPSLWHRTLRLTGCSMEQEPSEDSRFVYMKRADFDYVLRVIPVKVVSSTLSWHPVRPRYFTDRNLTVSYHYTYLIYKGTAYNAVIINERTRVIFWTLKHLTINLPRGQVMWCGVDVFWWRSILWDRTVPDVPFT